MGVHQPDHSYAQIAFQGRNDDGSETTATSISTANQIWTQQVGKIFRLRFLVSRLASTGNHQAGFRLQYSHNNGAFAHVGDEGDGVAVEMRATAQATSTYNHGDSCTQQLGSVGPGLFQTNNFGVVEGGVPISDEMRWASDVSITEAEFEYTILFNAGVVLNGDTIELKLFYNETSGGSGNSEFDAYPEVPIFTILVSKTLRLKGGTATIKGGTIQLR